jgi:hypothetical protein
MLGLIGHTGSTNRPTQQRPRVFQQNRHISEEALWSVHQAVSGPSFHWLFVTL